MLVDIPDQVIVDLRSRANDIEHGILNLAVHIRGYKVHFYRFNREESFAMDKTSEGMPPNSLRGKTYKNAKRNNERRVYEHGGY